MVDITLILPTTQVQGLGAGGQQAQSATQTGVPAVPQLSSGSFLAGIIVGNDANGSYFLKTEQGTVTLKSTVPLTYNSDVLIRIDSTGTSNANARIISVNGEAYSTFSSPVTADTDSLSPSLQARAQIPVLAAEAPDQPLPRVIAVTATIVPAPAGSAAAASPSIPVPAGTPVILYTSPPQVGTSPAAQTPAAILLQTMQPLQSSLTSTQQPASSQPATTATQSGAAPTAPTIPLPAEPLPSNVSKLLVAQPQAMIRPANAESVISALSPPPVSTLPPPVVQTSQYAAYSRPALPPSVPAPPTAAIPSQLTANIAVVNEDGNITLQTPQGLVTIKPDNATLTTQLPMLSNLTLSFPSMQTVAALTGKATPGDTFTTTLQQIFSLVSSIVPEAAKSMQARLPSIGPDFISNSIAFTSALLKGNMRKVLGDVAYNVVAENDSSWLLEKLATHASRAAQSFSSSPEQPQQSRNWQAFSLPYVYQGAIQEARLYVKREPPRKPQADGKKSTNYTRFVLEVSFSDIGDLQLDGIVLPRESNTIFDLIIRTQAGFSVQERNDIIAIYNEAAEATGFRGGVHFQVVREFPVKPLAEIITEGSNDLIA